MALKSLGRISGRLHFLAQNQVTAQAVKAIYSQEYYWRNLTIWPQSDMSRCFSKRSTGLALKGQKETPGATLAQGLYRELKVSINMYPPNLPTELLYIPTKTTCFL